MLYFDPDTFRHLRTTYEIDSSTTGGFGTSPGTGTYVGTATLGTEVRRYLTEEFGDFREVDGITLPFAYKLQYSSAAGRITNWILEVTNVSHPQTLDESVFNRQGGNQ
jgi:hypothetical protein